MLELGQYVLPPIKCINYRVWKHERCSVIRNAKDKWDCGEICDVDERGINVKNNAAKDDETPTYYK